MRIRIKQNLIKTSTPFSLAAWITFVILYFLSLNLFGQQNCVLRKDQDSIKVFTCHSDKSKFKSIKTSLKINASYSQLVSMVMDIKNYNRWQYNTYNPKILKDVHENEIIYYVQVEAPWPVSDRDMIIHLTILQDPETKVLTITANSESDYLPKVEGFVRVPISKSTWVVKQIGENTLAINYSIEIDPGGSVPAWMVNMVCAEAPYVSFKNLKDKIHTLKNSKPSFITD